MQSPELFYLVAAAIFTGVLWIPYVIGLVKTRGLLQPEDYVTAPTRPLPDWVNRANRAHLNAVENLLPFAAIVLAANAIGYSTDLTGLLAALYFWFRVAHGVVRISGFNSFMARTVIFNGAWISMIVFGVVVLMQLM